MRKPTELLRPEASPRSYRLLDNAVLDCLIVRAAVKSRWRLEFLPRRPDVEKDAVEKEQLQRLREALEEKRLALREALDALVRDSAETVQSSAASKLPLDDADAAPDVLDQDLAMFSIESEDELLRKVEAAIAKIDAGVYGMCEECGKPIEDARLEMLPFATTCVACQKKIDERRKALYAEDSRSGGRDEAEERDSGEEDEEEE